MKFFYLLLIKQVEKTIYFEPKVKKLSFLTRKLWKLQQNLMMQIMQAPTTTTTPTTEFASMERLSA